MIENVVNLSKLHEQPLLKHRRLLRKQKIPYAYPNKLKYQNKKTQNKPNNLGLTQLVSFIKKMQHPAHNGQYPTANSLPKQTIEKNGKPTLVLDLDKTLISSSIKPVDEYDFSFVFAPTEKRQVRVYVQKRPYLDLFLQKCSEIFEIVVFTASMKSYAEPILDQLDPEHKFIQHRLYRNSCLVLFGTFIKDLSKINRKISTIAIVDDMPISYCLHPQNGIHIKPFVGFDKADTELIRVFTVLSLISKEQNLVLSLSKIPECCKNFQKKNFEKELLPNSDQRPKKRSNSFPFITANKNILY
ncbi:nli interacting factor-like phosphatase family protein [Anaeramoeba flamelloides]|uniref:Nli interacting factor-like phosphatase family protein n=1 Tax=Anaeramoeba flamelloides TaxID=1746091 RepID=A0AAV7ZAR4_9EUKA|nr:nli interacting factor-like phosphatase family protein [Anaeramoeba flamelloides]